MAIRNWTGLGDGITWANAGNWDVAVPVTGDDVYITKGSGSNQIYGSQSNVLLSSLTIGLGFGGSLSSGSGGYFAIGASNVTIGQPSLGTGSSFAIGFVAINLGANAAVILALGGSNLNFIGSGSNRCYVVGGTVGWASLSPSDTATVFELDVSASAGVANLNRGAALATGNCSAGTINIYGSATTLTTSGSGALNQYGTNGSVTTINCGGRMTLNARPGTIGTLTVFGAGAADFSQNPGAISVGTLNHYSGGRWVSNSATPGHVSIGAYNKIQGGTLTLSQ